MNTLKRRQMKMLWEMKQRKKKQSPLSSLSKRKNPLKKLLMWQQRINKKAGRAARFGISSVPAKGLSSDNKPMVNLDKPKERAQKFGLNVSSISRKSEDDEKLKKRKGRFGIVTSSAGTGTTEDTEAKNRKRAEHFGIA
uniref:THO1-MOS11 C-terminal domain-containing protein n=1 Tax=Colobus angolensis palliatus TaxID=336983 RepID=A0A2K5J046_COLAP